jgi:Mrp family chromosome partitioning ATPase
VDRIRKALELSRAQRSDGPRPANAAAAAPQTIAPVVSGKEDATQQVVRVRSQRVPVDERVLKRNRLLLAGADDVTANAYKKLRIQMLHLLRKHGYSSVAIVSPSNEDGRTLTATNLAIAVADDPGHTALLVDMDLRQPSVHRYFGLEPALGVGDCLRRNAEVGDVLLRPESFPKLSLLPGTGAQPRSPELLAGDSARSLAAELRTRYANRIVIYDLPPLLATADALAFLPCVEAVLLVACESRTRRNDIAESLNLLRGVPLVGTVLNGSRERRAV